MKKLWKAFVVAFSIYSKIPMPRFEWASEDMRYHLCFFPLVGVVIGALEWGWYLLGRHMGSSQLTTVCIALVIPILLTGGFHLDGFMDTCDAIHSYQSRERRLEILKDPHIGAFSVIQLVCFFALLAGALGMITSEQAVISLTISFFYARVLSAISVIGFQPAKENGMLRMLADTATKKRVLTVLLCELVAGMCALCIWGRSYGIVVVLSGLAVFLYYRVMSDRRFGGITGDLAGFFVTLMEGMAIVGVAVLEAVCF